MNAASELFATKGFERTTTAEICKAAGMSSGNLFHYFPNKRAIFIAIFEDDGDGKAERLAEAQAGDDPWGALLEVVDLLAAPAMDPLTPPLVMEAMVQTYRDPELEALLSRDNADEQAAITALLATRRSSRPSSSPSCVSSCTGSSEPNSGRGGSRRRPPTGRAAGGHSQPGEHWDARSGPRRIDQRARAPARSSRSADSPAAAAVRASSAEPVTGTTTSR